jgi:hypothetical protein
MQAGAAAACRRRRLTLARVGAGLGGGGVREVDKILVEGAAQAGEPVAAEALHHFVQLGQPLPVGGGEDAWGGREGDVERDRVRGLEGRGKAEF